MPLLEQLQHLIDNKTKPPGSLGRLEALAVQMGVIQGSTQPSAAPAALYLFASDHGVYEQGVSPYPQAVTAQMVGNILTGGAASSVMARLVGAALQVIDVGVLTDLPPHAQLTRAKVRAASADLSQVAAMSEAELGAAIEVGRAALRTSSASVVMIGEMGIANTTPATALCCALLSLPPEQIAGPGTGLDAAGVAHKVAVISRALALHTSREPLEVLRCLGGLEIAAMTGAYLQAAAMRKVILVDGFIATAALLVAVRLEPAVLDCCVFSHSSGEPGHQPVLAALGAKPLLDLGLRLGEGTGALTAYPLLRAACALLNEMASFESAQVSERA
jgi:nicotinate-nucleotide--dimethylbenzimidazole phosphoribosyltransferase